MNKMRMQRVKRFFGVVLVVVLLVGILPGRVLAEEDISGKFTCAHFLSVVRNRWEVPNDGPIFPSHVAGITELWAHSQGITSLDGIEYFTGLEVLSVNSNRLKSIDVSNNHALTSLSASRNQLTTLDISNNTALTSLSVDENQLTSLDVSNNTALTLLSVGENQLTSLDVSNNSLLTMLFVWSNQLTILDLSNNPVLTTLWVYNNQLTNLDVSNNPALAVLSGSNNQLTSIDVSNNPELEILEVCNNQLTSIDVSNSPVLTRLSVSNNQLTNLDISNNPALFILIVNNNQLTSLDVSSNSSLWHLVVHFNLMTSPDDVIGWCNLFWAYDTLLFTFNPQIQNITTTFTCPNFLAYVRTLPGIPTTENIYNTHVRNITQISASNLNITSLSGIQHFSNIENLVVQGNNLTELDLSGLHRLRHLNASNNNLTTLNVTDATSLEAISISRNNISTIIGLDTLWWLRTFWAEGNAFTSLAFDHFAPLEKIDVRGNTPPLSRANITGWNAIDLPDYNPAAIFRPRLWARVRIASGLAY